MPGFLGEYKVSVDNKGRVRLPSGIKKQLSPAANGRLVVNRGFEQCLVVYPMDQWELITARINQLNTFRKDEREFVRFFFRGATEVVLDENDRINLPNHLLEYAGIDGEMTIAARQNVMELWNPKQYDGLMKVDSDRFADLAEKVMGDKKTENPE